jgi:general secretion pathway protein H
MRPTSSRRPREAGFTLIEMMVVLAILALSMTVAPAISAGIAGSRLRAASDRLVAVLREVRNEAIRRDAPAEMALSLPGRGYATTLRPGFQRLPAVVARLEVAPARLASANGIVRIRFEADGTATPARILLVNGTRAAVIEVDWLSGRVHQGG